MRNLLFFIFFIFSSPPSIAQSNTEILQAERENTKVFVNKIRSNFFDSLTRDEKRVVRKTKIRFRKQLRINAWVINRNSENYIYISDLLPIYITWLAGAMVDSVDNQRCLDGYSRYLFDGYAKVLERGSRPEKFLEYAYPFYRAKNKECGGKFVKWTEAEKLDYSNLTGGALGFFLLHEYAHILLGHQIAYNSAECEDKLDFEYEADWWALERIIEKDVDPIIVLLAIMSSFMVEMIHEEYSSEKLNHLTAQDRFLYLEKKIRKYWKENPNEFGDSENMSDMVERLQFMKSEFAEIYGVNDEGC